MSINNGIKKGKNSNKDGSGAGSEVSKDMEKELMDLIFKNWGAYCSSCGAKKTRENLKVYKRMGSVVQILSECSNCGMKMLISALPTQMGIAMQISQMRSDANDNEMVTLTTPVTSNDYLEFYNKIKKISSSSGLIEIIDK